MCRLLTRCVAVLIWGVCRCWYTLSCGQRDGNYFYRCLVCQDGLERKPFDCQRHEGRQEHTFDAEVNSAARGNSTQLTSQVPSPLDSVILEDALRALLASASSQPNQPLYLPGHPNVYGEPNFPTSARSPSPVTGIDWNLLEAYEDPVPD